MKGDFRVEWHQSTGCHYLYVDLGVDASDGRLTTAARPATDYEISLWECGKKRALAQCLQRQGVPVNVPRSWVKTAWSRLRSALRGLL